MAKIKLYIAKAQSSNSGAAKGTAENPYTEAEYEAMLNNGTWPGGYVQNLGYCMKEVVISSSYPGLSDDLEFSDDSWFSDDFDSWDFGSDPLDNSGDGGSTQPSGTGGSGNNNNGGNHGGNITSGGSGTSGGNSSANIIDVIPTSAFKGYLDSDKAGCFNRCREMLAEAKCQLNGNEIAMTHYDSNGRATTATDKFKSGLNYIDGQLRQKKPVIVAVDYKKGTSMGETRADQAGDHFVIIVGGSQTKGYHYYDPATASRERGTSLNNLFKMDGGLMKSTNTCTSADPSRPPRYYILTSVRENK